MKTIDQIKDRCRVDEFTGCWLWAGAMVGGKYPRIWQTEDGEDKSMPGRRAAKPPSARELTPAQIEWHVNWTGGSCVVVNSADEALAAIGATNG